MKYRKVDNPDPYIKISDKVAYAWKQAFFDAFSSTELCNRNLANGETTIDGYDFYVNADHPEIAFDLIKSFYDYAIASGCVNIGLSPKAKLEITGMTYFGFDVQHSHDHVWNKEEYNARTSQFCEFFKEYLIEKLFDVEKKQKKSSLN